MEWDNSVMDCAASFTRHGPYGLMGRVLLQAQYVAMTGGEYVPPIHPGHVPVQAAEQTAYKIELEIYSAEVRDYIKLKNAMVLSLSEDTREPMNEVGHLRMVNRSPAWIRQTMFVNYGAMTAQELANAKNKLSMPYDPSATTLSKHLQVHTQVHNIAAANFQDITESDKVNHLRQSLLPCGLFNDACAAYSRVHTTIVEQTFLNFRTAMQLENDNRDSNATITTAGYAGAINQADLATMVAKAVAEAFKAQGNLQSAPRVVAAPNVRAASKQFKKYCWTHGSCAHSSKECQRQAAGHLVAATYRNQMGGKKA